MASNNTDRDLYAILHLNRDADAASIQQAYRRLSLLYHPDKHTDARTKQLAMDLFIQVKRAYDVLDDPDKRAIYDVVGMKGLNTEGWEIITRTRTTREILDEYERLAREREERRFNQITNPNGSVHLTTNLGEIFNPNKPSSSSVQLTEFTVEQSIEIPIRTEDTVTIDATVTTRKGRGSGSLTTSFRHVLPDLSWFRIDGTFSQRPQIGLRYFRRLTQKLHASMATTLHLLPDRRQIVMPGFVFSLSYQLSHQLSSSLQWKTGRGSFMKGMLQYGNQHWTISSAVQLGVANTFAAIDGVYRFPDVCNLRISLKWFVFGPWIEYGIDRQLTKYTHGSATVAISSRLGVQLRLKLNRGGQSFTFPLQLSRDILPGSIFYGTILPVLAYFVVDRLILQPYALAEQARRDQRDDERRREATNAQELLRSIAEEVKHREGSNGLLILEGSYGHASVQIDVTIPLQALVKDSTLRMDSTASKSNFTGFYDPCLGQEKTLRIRYLFHSQIHSVAYRDTEAILLPNEDHLLS